MNQSILFEFVRCSSVNINSLKKNIQEYKDIFTKELSFCSKVNATFQVKENIRPTFKQKGPVPFARLQNVGVISPVGSSKLGSAHCNYKKKDW